MDVTVKLYLQATLGRASRAPWWAKFGSEGGGRRSAGTWKQAGVTTTRNQPSAAVTTVTLDTLMAVRGREGVCLSVCSVASELAAVIGDDDGNTCVRVSACDSEKTALTDTLLPTRKFGFQYNMRRRVSPRTGWYRNNSGPTLIVAPANYLVIWILF